MVSAETQPCAGQLQLPAVPPASVTPHKGNRRKETTSEEKRQERCQSHDKGRVQRKAREDAALQHFISTTSIADYFWRNFEPCSSDRPKELQFLLQDLIKALRGRTRKGKRGCSLSGCTWLQEITGSYPVRDFCSSKYFLAKVCNSCIIILVMSKDSIKRSRSSSTDKFSVCVLLPTVLLQSISALLLALSPCASEI